MQSEHDRAFLVEAAAADKLQKPTWQICGSATGHAIVSPQRRASYAQLNVMYGDDMWCQRHSLNRIEVGLKQCLTLSLRPLLEVNVIWSAMLRQFHDWSYTALHVESTHTVKYHEYPWIDSKMLPWVAASFDIARSGGQRKSCQNDQYFQCGMMWNVGISYVIFQACLDLRQYWPLFVCIFF